jgi:GNAT superfamily N-acetyltransferase
VEVREARASDWPAVSALLAELGRPDVRGREDEEEHRRAFEEYLGRADAVALVAVDGEDVVGFIDLEFRPRLNFQAEEAWVPDLVVAAESRSRGAGSALLAAAERLARERGCFSLTLESAVWRERAHAFYLREGLEYGGASFSKSLGGEGDEWPPRPR